MSNENQTKLGNEIKLLVANRANVVPVGVTFNVTKDDISKGLAGLFTANGVNLRDLGARIGVRIDKAAFANKKNADPLDISIYVQSRKKKNKGGSFLPHVLRCMDGFDRGYDEISILGNDKFLEVLNTLAVLNKHGNAKFVQAIDPSNGKYLKGWKKCQLDFEKVLGYLFCAEEISDGRVITFDLLGYKGKKANQFTLHLLKEIARPQFNNSKKDPLANIL